MYQKLSASVMFLSLPFCLLSQRIEAPGNSGPSTATVSCGVDTVTYPWAKASGTQMVSLVKGNVEGLAQWYARPAALSIGGISFNARVKDDAGIGKTATVTLRIYNSTPDSLPQGVAIAIVSATIDTNFSVWKAPLLAPVQPGGAFVVAVEYGAGLTENDTVLVGTNNPGDGAGESLGAGILNSAGTTVWLPFENLIPNPDRDALLYPWVAYSLTTAFSVPNDTLCVSEPTLFSNNSTAIAAHKMYNRRIQDPGTYGTAYSWGFGDGTNSTQQSPTKAYGSLGSYSALLTTAIRGYNTTCNEPFVMGIEIMARPVALFTSSATTVTAGDTVFFTYSGSGGTCAWDFGDSTVVSGCGDQTHVYDSAGTFTVTLSVSSPYGCQETTTHPVTVDPLVGVQEAFGLHGMKLWPNPTRHEVNCSWNGDGSESTTIQVIDLQGKVRLEQMISGGNQSRLNLNAITPGVYVIQVKRSGKTEFKKLILQD